MTQTAFNDDGEPELTSDFDYDSIDLAVFTSPQDLTNATPEAKAFAYQMTLHLVGWIVKNGSNEKDGIAIRACVIAWLTIPVFKRKSMAKLARGFGFKKQSVSRWVERAKKELPHLIKK